MSTPVDGLRVEKVHVWRGDRHVLKGVSLTLASGQLLHVSGPNGTGKTTLLRVICGLLRPEQGSVSWRGQSISSVRGEYQAALAYASHEPALKGDLTALENLRFAVSLKRRVSPGELRASLEQTGVAACADLPARVLSAGQRRRVAMARVLAMNAPLWLLDEPFTNLDAAGTRLLTSLLQSHTEGGGSALVVAHQELAMARDMRSLVLTA
jgi:heme exporter protein A